MQTSCRVADSAQANEASPEAALCILQVETNIFRTACADSRI